VQTHNRREKHMARAFATSQVERYGRFGAFWQLNLQ
jgi:hypothetical protein